jgi:hypothetical protein
VASKAWSYERERDELFLSNGKLPELKIAKSDLCEGCILGKQKRLSFTTIGRTPKPEKLEMVHVTSHIAWE